MVYTKNDKENVIIDHIFFLSSVELYVVTLFTLPLHVSALGQSSGATSLLLGLLQLSVHVYCVITRLFMI
jgi:hypothetical protein